MAMPDDAPRDDSPHQHGRQTDGEEPRQRRQATASTDLEDLEPTVGRFVELQVWPVAHASSVRLVSRVRQRLRTVYRLRCNRG